MKNYDFLNLISYPSFVIDVECRMISCKNDAFNSTRFDSDAVLPLGSVAVLQPMIEKIINCMKEVEAVILKYTLPIYDGVTEVKANCQYADALKQQIIVVLDTKSESAIMPYESYITAQLVPGGILILEVRNDQYVVRYANEAFYKILGYTREECRQMARNNIFDYLYEEDRTPVYVKFMHQIAKDGKIYLDGRMKCKDDCLRWVNLLGTFIIGVDGAKLLFAVVTDISESLKLREQLFQEKQSFSALEHVSKDIVFRYDFLDNTITFSGGLLYRLTGLRATKYTIDNLMEGNTILSIDTVHVKQAIRAIRSGKKKNFVFRVQDGQNNKYWLSIDYYFIHKNDNTDISIVGVITDETEEIAAKAYYDRAITLWSAKQDNCVAAIAFNVNNGAIISGHSKMFPGLPVDSLDGKHYSKAIAKHIVNERSRKQITAGLMPHTLQKAFREGKTHFTFEAELSFHDELYNWYQLSVSLLQNPKSGNLIALLKWTDINIIRLQQKINHLLFYDAYDYICCIFVETGSYKMMSNTESGSTIPMSSSKGYEAIVSSVIDKSVAQEDREYLKFSFSLKNLVSQLSIVPMYSIIGHGYYPDGSPATKFNSFTYLDARQQIILYTRKDITNKEGTLSFKSTRSVCSVPFKDIIYVESFRKRSLIVTVNERYEVNEMLSGIQERLPGKEFIRCHRCYIVRYSAVQRINRYIATMSNGDEVSVSRNHVDALKKSISITEDYRD